MRIAVNGAGRIGKNFIRAYLEDLEAQKKIELAVINVGKADPATIAYSLTYDTLLGTYRGKLTYANGFLNVDGVKSIAIIQELDPEKAPWKKYKIDWVVECTGKFTTRLGAQKHQSAGAQGVLISAPSEDADMTVIFSVNESNYSSSHQIVSLGSCTTNAVFPLLKVLDDTFGIQSGFISTVHAYTNTQTLLDIDSHGSDLRRSRAAALNIIPSSTGAASVVSQIMPHLVSKIVGSAYRVPVGKVSIADLTLTLNKPATREEVNRCFYAAANGSSERFIGYCDQQVVSSDFAGDSHSVIFDSLLTQVVESSVKVFGWYDNEWAYSQRLLDFLRMIS